MPTPRSMGKGGLHPHGPKQKSSQNNHLSDSIHGGSLEAAKDIPPHYLLRKFSKSYYTKVHLCSFHDKSLVTWLYLSTWKAGKCNLDSGGPTLSWNQKFWKREKRELRGQLAFLTQHYLLQKNISLGSPGWLSRRNIKCLTFKLWVRPPHGM